MKKEMTEDEARVKAESYCAVAERCKADIVRKFQQWGVPVEAWDKIMCRLEKEKYLDERRYAVAYVRDKYRFNQWGRIKISQGLRMKQVDSQAISEALEEIDELEYASILLALLTRKLKSIKASSEYERNGKLIRFAAGHGYEMEAILSCMKRIGCDDEFL